MIILCATVFIGEIQALSDNDIKIKCRNIWKLFGNSPKQFLEANGNNPSNEQLKQSGYIGAVQDVSFDVYEGEILIIMGLIGLWQINIGALLNALARAYLWQHRL